MILIMLFVADAANHSPWSNFFHVEQFAPHENVSVGAQITNFMCGMHCCGIKRNLRESQGLNDQQVRRVQHVLG